MLFDMSNGWKTAAFGAGCAVALELGVHILVHYTVPGATFAAGLAKSLAPVMDGLGLTTIFGNAATGVGSAVAGVAASEASNQIAGEFVNQAIGNSAEECLAGGFCPIHNPIDGKPLIESASSAVVGLQSLGNLPTLELGK